MRKKNWMLCNEIFGFIDGDSIYLGNGGTSSMISRFRKLIPKYPGVEIILQGSTKFKIKIESELKISIKSASFPKDIWYNLKNSTEDSQEISSILTQLNCKSGEFDEEFEAVFSNDPNTGVSFITKSMREYSKAISEVKRKLNCELNKKSRKWKAGNRYDTVEGTYFYLGEFQSRSKLDGPSHFLKDGFTVPVHLYVSQLRDNEKTIKDVLVGRTFGDEEDNIKVISKIPSAVDSGKALDSTITLDISKLWPEMLKLAMSESNTIDKFGYRDWIDVKKVLDVFQYFKDIPDIKDFQVPSEFKRMLNEIMFDHLICNWEINTDDIKISLQNSLEDNISRLTRLMLSSINSSNPEKQKYYKSLFYYLGINIETMATLILSQWGEDMIFKNFNNYTKYSKFLKTHYTKDTFKTSSQRVKSTNYSLTVITVEQLYGKSELTNRLIELGTFAKNNFGRGVSAYKEINIGTQKNPQEYIEMVITLEDIIDNYGDISKVPTKLIDEIINQKFYYLVIRFDKTENIS